MIVNIKGSTKKIRALVESATWYYAEKLMSKRLYKTLELNIKLVRNLGEKVQKDFASGMNGKLRGLLEVIRLIWILLLV